LFLLRYVAFLFVASHRPTSPQKEVGERKNPAVTLRPDRHPPEREPEPTAGNGGGFLRFDYPY
jgi:hypothetical protein